MREYTQFYINGQWVDPVTPKTLEVLDPSTEEACAAISLGSEADVDLAVAAAKAAFQSFSQTSVEERVGMLERMAEIGMPLCVHGEVTTPDIDIFDREAVFIDRVLQPLVDRMPQLKVIFEHITTMQAVSFVESAGPNVAATITPQHLHINRNDILVGGIRPHMYCLPVAKREQHRLALRGAATSGSAKYFLGTDSAPHHRHDKESDCGCAGIFNAPFALESYIQVFDDEDALGNFEAFASLNGPSFYGMAPNDERITLEKAPVDVPREVDGGAAPIVPFNAGETLAWRLVS